MGRPRKPSNILELSGAFDKNPNRRLERENEPDPGKPIKKTPPKYFDENEIECFKHIIGWAADGVLRESDYLTVEVTATLLAKVRERVAVPAEIARLLAALGTLGMNPADRSRVQVVKPKKKDGWSDM